MPASCLQSAAAASPGGSGAALTGSVFLAEVLDFAPGARQDFANLIGPLGIVGGGGGAQRRSHQAEGRPHDLGGYLVNAELASDVSTPAFESLFEVWLRTSAFTGMSTEAVEKMRASFGRGVALLPVQEVEPIIASSGFGAPVPFFQALLIHAWYARAVH